MFPKIFLSEAPITHLRRRGGGFGGFGGDCPPPIFGTLEIQHCVLVIQTKEMYVKLQLIKIL